MDARLRHLPMGWYPDSEVECRAEIDSWNLPPIGAKTAKACIVPHAGWAYSGSLALATMARLEATPDTVVVFGGHCPGHSKPLMSSFPSFMTPFGPLDADSVLVARVMETFGTREDVSDDNTVEVLLPLVKFLFPAAKVLWLRVPNAAGSYSLGETLAKIAGNLGISAVAIGSTDLTHYGSNYGFSPQGSGDEAEQWVLSVNDKTFIDAVMAHDTEGMIASGQLNKAACSSGAAAAASGFAHAHTADTCVLVGHRTSRDVFKAESFVGYAGISFYPSVT